ncbi:MAG: hypothetical protein INR73_07880 [Williamsia sp.]|nr:hypothetical protein [Williamsia sp.]
MKTLLCLCCLFVCYSGDAQNKIFYSSSDLANVGEEGHGIAKIRLPWGRLGKNILVKYTDGCQTSYSKKAIWGFEKDGRKLRHYNGEIFEIVDTGTIVLYKTFSPHPMYYFSKDFQSDIMLLERSKLMKALDALTLVRLWKENNLVKQIW